MPVFLTHDLVSIIVSLGAAFFFAEIVIGPMWAIPMDIAPKYSGTAAGLMNTGSALAAILSPLAFGFIIDATGNWQLPFAGSLGFLLLGALWLRPCIPSGLRRTGAPVIKCRRQCPVTSRAVPRPSSLQRRRSALRGSFSSRIAALYANTAMTVACCTMSSRCTRSNVSMFE